MVFLMGSFMITSALSLSSCKKDTSSNMILGDTHQLTVRYDPIQYFCPICGRDLAPTPSSIPLPPPFENTYYSCYHEYEVGEACPYMFCNLYPRHHYHFFYVGHDLNSFYNQNVHIGGGTHP